MAGTGGAVRLNDYSSLEASDTQFTSNTAVQRGGAIFANTQSCIDLTRCSFEANSATIGAAIVAENESEFGMAVLDS